jgi:hypothetical protein
LSVQETLPYVATGGVQVWPWSEDFWKTTLNPFIHSTYTSPVSGTTSTIGSYCPSPLQGHSGTLSLHVCPLSLEIEIAMCGIGQLPGHGLASPYRVASRYT